MESAGKLPDPEVARDDLALLPYTSGTTGSPKGCMLTHGNVMHNAVGSTFWLGMTPETVSLTVLPLFHITGLVCVMHASIYAGGTMVIMPRWDRELAGQLISRYRVSHWTSIPTMIIDLLASPNLDGFDLSSLAYIGGGGAAMPRLLPKRFSQGLG
jgi:fatty-acyl-CoA synthase